MASGSLLEYWGYGPFASRPVTPDNYAGVLALYYGTDTGVLYLWDGSVWNDIATLNPLVASPPTGGWQQGDMLYFDSADQAFKSIQAGVPGQVLTMSSGEIPIWDDLPP